MQDPAAGTPMAADTIFRIYSMTKPVVSTALMLLFERGMFRLTDPVAAYIPAFAATRVMTADGGLEDVNPLRPMQIRDLLAHTSGLTYDFLENFPSGELYRKAKLMHDASRSLKEVIEELATIPLAFQPGTRWHYSLGIDVAAYLIEVLSGMSPGEFMQKELFAPLGMHDTAFGVPAEQRHRLAAMGGLPDLFAEGQTFSALFGAFMAGDVGLRNVEATYPSDNPQVFQRGGIGLFSTAGDYLRFAQMLCNGGELDGVRLFGRKTLELMHSNHLPAELMPYEIGGGLNPGWGFGMGSRVMLDPAATGGSGSVGEFGWAGAAKTYYWVDPAEQLVGVFMAQQMVGFEQPEIDLRNLTYAAIVD
jgi:CubicO group peptidase (beta-lactamase class C family)